MKRIRTYWVSPLRMLRLPFPFTPFRELNSMSQDAIRLTRSNCHPRRLRGHPDPKSMEGSVSLLRSPVWEEDRPSPLQRHLNKEPTTCSQTAWLLILRLRGSFPSLCPLNSPGDELSALAFGQTRRSTPCILLSFVLAYQPGFLVLLYLRTDDSFPWPKAV